MPPERDPRQFLLPSSDGKKLVVSVTQIRVSDKGNRPKLVWVVVAGVLVEGIVDTAADITIVGAETFKCISPLLQS